jgi:endonuclease YncB( thermonuclease family)
MVYTIYIYLSESLSLFLFSSVSSHYFKFNFYIKYIIEDRDREDIIMSLQTLLSLLISLFYILTHGTSYPVLLESRGALHRLMASGTGGTGGSSSKPKSLLIASAILAATLAIGTTRTFDTADQIPTAMIRSQVEISGIVRRVSDGDTFRIRHQKFFFALPWDSAEPINKKTIIVRVAAVDCPELAKPGKGLSGQPFAEEAKAFVQDNILGKRVNVRLLGMDRYGRVLGTVKYANGFKQSDLGEELLKRGLAVVYRQGKQSTILLLKHLLVFVRMRQEYSF